MRFRQYLTLLFLQAAENPLLISSKALIWILPARARDVAEGHHVAEGHCVYVARHSSSETDWAILFDTDLNVMYPTFHFIVHYHCRSFQEETSSHSLIP